MDDDTGLLAGGDRTGVSLHAGFPNPAADVNSSAPLSLDKLLIRHPSSTYLFRVRGDDWQDEGIFDGDIALIDRAIVPRGHDLVIGWQDDNFAFSRYGKGRMPNPWGTVTTIIHTFHQPPTPQ